ncbi:MAG: cytochrome c3 family protein [Nitrospinota bacterium]
MMRTWLKICLVALAVAVAGAVAPPVAFGQITGTDHDFSAAGEAGDPCRTCHVPHNPGSGLGLLWNHTLSLNTLTFGTGQTTVAGTNLPTNINTWTGTTRYCLSCHDGSVAIGNVISGTDWGSTTNFVTGDKVIAPSGNLLGNHPVAIPYPDQVGAIYNGITTGHTTAAPTNGFVLAPAGVKIYGTTAGQKGIECASCHDPHKNATKFLRVAEASLCQSCHIK